MKAKMMGSVIIGLGLLVILTPWVIFPVCKSAEMPCRDARLLETITGALMMGLGIIPIVSPSRKTVTIAAVGTLIASVLVIFLIGVVPGVCANVNMRCNYGTRPAMITVGMVIAAAGVAGVALSKKMK